MKETGRVVSLSRHRAPNFVMLGGLELMQLRKLPIMTRWLYMELLAMADHATGRIATTRAVLLALMDFDTAPQTNKSITKTQTMTVDRLRTALADLEALRLVSVDPVKNQKAQGLFLRVQSRNGISAPANMLPRVLPRVPKPAKQATARVRKGSGSDAPPSAPPGVQERDLSPIPLGYPQDEPRVRTPMPESIAKDIAALRQRLRPREAG